MQLQRDRVQIFAHRGGASQTGVPPMLAFQQAIIDGADYVECDVRRSHDGVLYIRHDPRSGPRLATLSYAEIVAELGPEQAPRLEELLRVLQGNLKLNTHLKERGLAREVITLAKRYLPPQDILVTSFFEIDVVDAKLVDSRVKTGLLIGKRLRRGLPSFVADYFPATRAHRAGVDVLVCKDRLMKWWCRPMMRIGLPIVVWTVNDPEQLRRYFRDRQVIGVLTDNVGLAMRVRARADEVR